MTAMGFLPFPSTMNILSHPLPVHRDLGVAWVTQEPISAYSFLVVAALKKEDKVTL